MCLATLDEQNTISSVLKEWFARNAMFTSVDIANDIKDMGVFIRNRNVASYLRDYCLQRAIEEGRAYVYTPIDVTLKDGTVTTAFLYHPYGSDPNDYTTRNKIAKTPPADNTTVPSFETVPVPDDDQDDTDAALMSNAVQDAIDTYTYLNDIRKQRNAVT